MSTKSSDSKNYSHLIQNVLLKTFFLIVKYFPLRCGLYLGRLLGLTAYCLLKKRRKITLDNIEHAKSKGFLTEITDTKQLAHQIWKHLGMVGSEFLYYYSHNPNKLLKNTTLDGEENFKKALSKNKGIIMVTGHIGNWELIGIYLSLKGYILNPLVRTQDNLIFNELIENKRHSIGMKTIPRDSFLRPILKALQRNEIVPFLSDQTEHHGLQIPFFGRTAHLPQGAAEFSLKTGSPIIFVHIVREGLLKHHIYISKEIEINSTRDFDTDLLALTTRLVAKFEDVIEKKPSQWLWMHKLWK